MDHEIFNDLQSCPIHGEEYLRECNICGAHFCTHCFPRSLVCEECAEDEDETDVGSDAEDLSDYEDLLEDEDEDEIDRLIEESDLLPPEDIEDDDF